MVPQPHQSAPERQAARPMRHSTADHRTRSPASWPDLPPLVHPRPARALTRGAPPLPDTPAPVPTARHAGGGMQPVLIRGRVDHIDGTTGELLHRYTTAHEPGGVLPIACKTRRATRCPPCAETYRADTYQLIRAGLTGGKGIPTSAAATRPRSSPSPPRPSGRSTLAGSETAACCAGLAPTRTLASAHGPSSDSRSLPGNCPTGPRNWRIREKLWMLKRSCSSSSWPVWARD